MPQAESPGGDLPTHDPQVGLRRTNPAGSGQCLPCDNPNPDSDVTVGISPACQSTYLAKPRSVRTS